MAAELEHANVLHALVLVEDMEQLCRLLSVAYVLQVMVLRKE